MIDDNLEGMWEKFDIKVNKPAQNEVSSLLDQGKKLYQSGDHDKSCETLLNCIEKDPDNIEAHYYLGLIYTKSNDFNKAIVHFNEIVMSPYQYLHVNHVHQVLSYIYSLQKDYETAKEHLETLLKLDKKNITVLSIMGYINYKQEKYDLAKDFYHQILAIDEKNSNAYNSLGMIYIDSEENIDEGIVQCKKALELNPGSPAYLDSIGWGYFKLKNEVEAMQYLKEAYEKASDNQEIKEHLKKVLNI